MSTWTSKVFLGAICAAGLGGCGVFPELGNDGEASPEHLKTAKLGRGISVAAPEGYCVDQISISRNFALMARCDRVSASRLAGDVPLALIAVTAPQMDGTARLPEPASLVAESEALLDSYQKGDLQLVKVAGAPPAAGLSGQFWRGVGLVGSKAMGLAIYPKANDPDLDRDAVVLLEETFERSAALSRNGPQRSGAAEATTETAENAPKKERRGLFAGLFK